MKSLLSLLSLLCICTTWSMDHNNTQSQALSSSSSSNIQAETMSNFFNLLCKHRGNGVSDDEIEEAAEAILNTIIESHKSRHIVEKATDKK